MIQNTTIYATWIVEYIVDRCLEESVSRSYYLRIVAYVLTAALNSVVGPT